MLEVGECKDKFVEVVRFPLVFFIYEIGTWKCRELVLYFYQSAGGFKKKNVVLGILCVVDIETHTALLLDGKHSKLVIGYLPALDAPIPCTNTHCRSCFPQSKRARLHVPAQQHVLKNQRTCRA